MTYVIAHIADIHFGAQDPKGLYEELESEFLNYIKELPLLDAVIIEGDFFDKKLSLNSEHVKYALEFLSQLVRICKDKKLKLRIIKGTESHDNKQLELFEIAMKVSDVDIGVISTVYSEYLFEDFHILYIPEEYISGMEYYDDYFDKRYDMVVGHGMFTEVSFTSKSQESEATHPKAPIFDSNQIIRICKGPIFFGHIHKSQCIKERIFYTGSFSRWCFGEEEDKGFYISASSGLDFKVEFIKNNKAKIYDTVEITCDDNPEEKLKTIYDLIDILDYDHLRVKITLPETYANPALFTRMATEYFNKFDNIKIMIENLSKTREKKESEERVNKLVDKYGFVFDKNITYEDKISKFIKEKYDKHISIDSIRDYLYTQVIRK